MKVTSKALSRNVLYYFILVCTFGESYIKIGAREPVKGRGGVAESLGSQLRFRDKTTGESGEKPEEGQTESSPGQKVPPDITYSEQEGTQDPNSTVPVSTTGLDTPGSAVTLSNKEPSKSTSTINISVDSSPELTKVQKELAGITAVAEEDISGQAAEITALITRVNELTPESEYALTPAEKITFFTQALNTLAGIEKRARQQEQSEVSGVPEEPPVTQSGFFWLVSKVTQAVQTATGAISALLKPASAVEIAQQLTKDSLENTLRESVRQLQLPTSLDEYTAQKKLLSQYASLADTYNLSSLIKEITQTYTTILTASPFVLEQQIQGFEKAYGAIGQYTTTSLAQKAEQLDVLSELVEKIPQGSLSADLVSRVQELRANLERDTRTITNALKNRLTELSKTSGDDTTMLKKDFAEAQSLRDALKLTSITTSSADTTLQQLADSTTYKIARLIIRSMTEQEITSNLQPLTGDQTTTTYKAKAEYKQRVKDAYTQATDLALYGSEDYEKQLSLLRTLERNITASTALSKEYMRDVSAPLASRIESLEKILKDQTTTPINQLDSQLGLYKLVPEDQLKVLQDYVKNNLADAPDTVQAQKQLVELLKAYEDLSTGNPAAASLLALMDTAGLSEDEQLVLKSLSGTASPTDVLGASSDEITARAQSGIVSLFSRALDAIRQSIGGKYTSIGRWLLTLGNRLRLTDDLGAVEKLATQVTLRAGPFVEFLNGSFIRKNFPALSGVAEAATSGVGLAQTGATLAGAAKARTGWLDWLGLKLQQAGETYLTKGYALTGEKYIDVDALFERAGQMAQSAESTPVFLEKMRDKASDLSKTVVNYFTQAKTEQELKTERIQQLRSAYDKAQKDMRQLLGLPDTVSPEELQKAFKDMVLMLKARRSTARDPGQVALVKEQLNLVSVKLVNATEALVSAYQDTLLTDPALALSLMAQDSFINPVTYTITASLAANQNVAPSDAVTDTINAVTAQASLDSAAVSALISQLDKFKELIDPAAPTNALSSNNLNSYLEALSALLTNNKTQIEQQLVDQRARVTQDVKAFQDNQDKK